MTITGNQAERIKSCVRSSIASTLPVNPHRELRWDLRTIDVFRMEVGLVLIALDKMCAELGLDFDPNTLPQQSVFKTFPRLANFCAYLQFRLTGSLNPEQE